MEMVKIYIPDRDQRDRGFVELGRRTRVVCLPGDLFIVPETTLGTLTSLKIEFEELDRGGPDYGEKALRDSIASKTQ